MTNYFNKYLKYKAKYLKYNQFGGGEGEQTTLETAIDEIIEPHSILTTSVTLENTSLTEEIEVEQLFTDLDRDKRINTLKLNNVYMTDNVKSKLFDLLKTHNYITSLYLRFIDLRDSDLKNIAFNLTHLIELDLMLSQIGDNGVSIISNALKKNSKLKILNLAENNITDVGIKSLAKYLETNQSLTNLNISANDIGVTGAIYIAETLKRNNTLTYLDLRLTQITACGFTYIAHALQENNSLEEIKLYASDIEVPDQEVIKTIAQTNQRLKILS